MKYSIEYSLDAVNHLKLLPKRQQQTVMDDVDRHLSYHHGRLFISGEEVDLP